MLVQFCTLSDKADSKCGYSPWNGLCPVVRWRRPERCDRAACGPNDPCERLPSGARAFSTSALHRGHASIRTTLLLAIIVPGSSVSALSRSEPTASLPSFPPTATLKSRFFLGRLGSPSVTPTQRLLPTEAL
ncbi:unnamed protein product [Schistocephalus solidus]|uniref:Secreted protein n=1 Tax=Schistocephalus solidus TaxID=70667 RepID=A0A183TGN9_SCHSO|nr:unnamed protein product [Schistocephalus solidus]